MNNINESLNKFFGGMLVGVGLLAVVLGMQHWYMQTAILEDRAVQQVEEELALIGGNNLIDFRRVKTLDELLLVMTYVPVTVSAGSNAAVALNKYLRRLTPEDKAMLAKIIKQPEPVAPVPKPTPIPPAAPDGYMLVPLPYSEGGTPEPIDMMKKQISIPENN